MNSATLFSNQTIAQRVRLSRTLLKPKSSSQVRSGSFSSSVISHHTDSPASSSGSTTPLESPFLSAVQALSHTTTRMSQFVAQKKFCDFTCSTERKLIPVNPRNNPSLLCRPTLVSAKLFRTGICQSVDGTPKRPKSQKPGKPLDGGGKHRRTSLMLPQKGFPRPSSSFTGNQTPTPTQGFLEEDGTTFASFRSARVDKKSLMRSCSNPTPPDLDLRRPSQDDPSLFSILSLAKGKGAASVNYIRALRAEKRKKLVINSPGEESKRAKWYDNRPRLMVNKYYQHNYSEDVKKVGRRKIDEFKSGVVRSLAQLLSDSDEIAHTNLMAGRRIDLAKVNLTGTSRLLLRPASVDSGL